MKAQQDAAASVGTQACDFERAIAQCVDTWAKPHSNGMYPMEAIIVLTNQLARVVRPGSPGLHASVCELLKHSIASESTLCRVVSDKGDTRT